MDDGLTFEESSVRRIHSSTSEAGTPHACVSPTTAYPQCSHNDYPSTQTRNPARRPRLSVFKELDLDLMPDDLVTQPSITTATARSPPRRHADSFNSIQSTDSSYNDNDYWQQVDRSEDGWLALWRTFSSSRLMTFSLVLLLAAPLLYDTPILGKAGSSILGASAGVIKSSEAQKQSLVGGKLVRPRANTDVNVCNRWSQQSALVNGTLYLYGGRATTDADQKTDEWNNNFLTIDVTKTWDTSAPIISGLPQPSGPPPVANGYLWNSHDSLFLYGGEYQETPPKSPSPYSLWEYNIKSATWIEHQNPKTSSGNNSDGGNQPVLAAAEGAGISVPELGRAWYFGGHQDLFTTPGWSYLVARIYLKSLLEFTFPGYSNDGVQSLGGGKTAGNDGAWRNITEGGIQDTARFPSRADSVLVYVPGYGVNGILINMGGGTNLSFVSTTFVQYRLIVPLIVIHGRHK